MWGYCVPSGALRKGDRFTSCPKQDRFENQDTADQRAMGADVNGTTLGGPSGRHTAPRGVTAWLPGESAAGTSALGVGGSRPDVGAKRLDTARLATEPRPCPGFLDPHTLPGL